LHDKIPFISVVLSSARKIRLNNNEILNLMQPKIGWCSLGYPRVAELRSYEVAGVAPVALVEERPASTWPPSLKLRRAKPSTHSYAAPRGLEERLEEP